MNSHSTATKVLVSAGVAAAFFLTLFAAQPPARGSDDFTVAAPPQTIAKAFPLAGTAPAALEVDNVIGSIHVIGDATGQIRMTAVEQVRGASQADVDEANREVHLDYDVHDNAVKIYVDGPFHCNGGCTWNGGFHWHSPDYTARFDFELHVPAGTALTLKTVTRGAVPGEAASPDIVVDRTSGDFALSDVNGGIALNDVAGSGSANSVNGQITANWRENPTAAVSFRTVNGGVHLYFRPGLSALVQYQTVNGNVYSDFDVVPQATADTSGEARGLRLYRSGRNATNVVQIGAGGPTITLHTVNGNIFIHKQS